MNEDDRDALIPVLNEALRRLSARLGVMDEEVRKARMENVVLTAAVAQVIATSALREGDPHQHMESLLKGAQAAADAIQQDPHADGASIEAAEGVMERLRLVTDACSKEIIDVRRELRRWWRPATWGW